MDEVETKQYCALVKVWVWAKDTKHAEKVVQHEVEYLMSDEHVRLGGVDYPVAGFAVVEVNEDGEV